LKGLRRQLLYELGQCGIFGRLIRYRHDVPKPGDQGHIDRAAQFERRFQPSEGPMVLFRQRLVNDDRLRPAFPPLHVDRDIDSPPQTHLLRGLLEGLIQMTQRTRQATGYFQKSMVHRTDFDRDEPVLPWRLPASESRHAADHRGPFCFQTQYE
jgi:hypothetical protein